MCCLVHMMIQKATLATNPYRIHMYVCVCMGAVHVYDSEYDPDFRTVSCPFFLGGSALLSPTDIHGLPVPGQKAEDLLCTASICSHNGLRRSIGLLCPAS